VDVLRTVWTARDGTAVPGLPTLVHRPPRIGRRCEVERKAIIVTKREQPTPPGALIPDYGSCTTLT
jgi:hypothetical protein